MEFLKLNQKLQIVLEENKNMTKSCVSQIIDYDNSSMLVAEPTYKSQPTAIPIGTVIEVLAVDPNCVYSFTTSVIGRQAQPPSLWLSLPETYRRVQRREYVRVNIKMPILITIKGDTDVKYDSLTTNILAEDIYREGYFNTISIDISGGGTKIFSPIQFESDTILNMLIRLPMKEISTSARVVRSDLNQKISEKDMLPKDYAKFNYITALCFKEIEDADRSTIIQLCFKRQLELRQRGLI